MAYPTTAPALTTTRATGDPAPAADHNATSVEVNAIGGDLVTARGASANIAARLTAIDTSVSGKAATAHTHAQADVTNLTTDLAAKAPLASPTFTGTPAAPTAAAGTSTTQLATTAFVAAAVATPVLNTQTASYTLVLADAGKVVEENSASATIITVPPNSTAAFAIGTMIELSRMGAGTVTVAAGAGVTIRSPNSLLAISPQYGSAGIRKRATDEWVLTGSLA